MRQLQRFHGSLAGDYSVDHARGRFAVDDTPPRSCARRAPTLSQWAFQGLVYNRRAYAALTVDDVLGG
jgi:hypothetical protein